MAGPREWGSVAHNIPYSVRAIAANGTGITVVICRDLVLAKMASSHSHPLFRRGVSPGVVTDYAVPGRMISWSSARTSQRCSTPPVASLPSSWQCRQ